MAIAQPAVNEYTYLFIVNNTTLKGIEMPIIAWVDGIPYSCDHLLWSLVAGGQDGRGQQIMSFNAWPVHPINLSIQWLQILS